MEKFFMSNIKIAALGKSYNIEDASYASSRVHDLN